ncbi:hypothetical protein GC194_04770 [bacterium]|nr:hypothetical protein [bacterium]
MVVVIKFSLQNQVIVPEKSVSVLAAIYGFRQGWQSTAAHCNLKALDYGVNFKVIPLLFEMILNKVELRKRINERQRQR